MAIIKTEVSKQQISVKHWMYQKV